MKRRFFKFSKDVWRAGELNSWFEHFVRQGIGCYIAAGKRWGYSLWVEGEDADTKKGETVELNPCGENIVACFLPPGPRK